MDCSRFCVYFVESLAQIYYCIFRRQRYANDVFDYARVWIEQCRKTLNKSHKIWQINSVTHRRIRQTLQFSSMIFVLVIIPWLSVYDILFFKRSVRARVVVKVIRAHVIQICRSSSETLETSNMWPMPNRCPINRFWSVDNCNAYRQMPTREIAVAQRITFVIYVNCAHRWKSKWNRTPKWSDQHFRIVFCMVQKVNKPINFECFIIYGLHAATEA